MAIFQFYKKQNALIHINIDAASFETETNLLLNQGFKCVGETVQAETSYSAFNKFKVDHLDEMRDIVNSHQFVSNHHS